MSKPDPSARKRAQDYKQNQNQHGAAEATAQTQRQPTVRPIEEWCDLVSQRIEQAINEGLFDNLPNKGKPLRLERNPFVPEEQIMAFDLLKNNELTPDWIGRRVETLHAIEHWRAKLQKASVAYAQRRRTLLNQADQAGLAALDLAWAAQLEGWRTELHQLNQRIEIINLEQPVAYLEIFKLRLEEEVQRASKDENA
jgi:DnaJ family protein C protein 28